MGRKTQKPLAQSQPLPYSSSDGSSSSSDRDSAASFSSDDPPSSLKPISTPAPTVAHSSDSDEEESPPAAPKPKEPEPKSKPGSSKRPSDKNGTEGKQPEKKARNESEKPSSEKKVLFQRVWSDDDEIILLKGMIEFRANKGLDPLSDPDTFFGFIKRSIQVPDVRKDQVMRKIRSIRQKFLNSLKKKPPTNPKELEALALGHQIWGNETVTVGTHKASNPVKVNGKSEDADDDEEEQHDVVDKGKMVLKIAKSENLDEGLIDVVSLFSDVNGAVVKMAIDKMEGSERVEMKNKVKKANAAALQAFLSRLDVLSFAANKMLDEIN